MSVITSTPAKSSESPRAAQGASENSEGSGPSKSTWDCTWSPCSSPSHWRTSFRESSSRRGTGASPHMKRSLSREGQRRRASRRSAEARSQAASRAPRGTCTSSRTLSPGSARVRASRDGRKSESKTTSGPNMGRLCSSIESAEVESKSWETWCSIGSRRLPLGRSCSFRFRSAGLAARVARGSASFCARRRLAAVFPGSTPSEPSDPSAASSSSPSGRCWARPSPPSTRNDSVCSQSTRFS